MTKEAAEPTPLVERLEERLRNHSGEWPIELINLVAEAATALTQAQSRLAEVESALKDAARYRHLRAKPHMLLHLKNSEFDAAIDEAIKRSSASSRS